MPYTFIMKTCYPLWHLMLLLALTGCAGIAPAPPPLAPPETQYSAQLVDADTGEPLTLSSVAHRVQNVDVVVVGEFHGHHGAHLLQSRLQAALYVQNPRQVLSLEQFDLNHQTALNRYLEGETGESELIEDANAWDNYRASYRPLVEFAKARNLQVIAANAPGDVVRCVGRKGPEYLQNLPEGRRNQLPAAPFTDTPAYQDKFIKAISGSHGTGDTAMSERLQNTYQAQLLRDNTMASRILDGLERYPEHQILHLTGTFHSEDRLGTVALLLQRAPETTVAVISPVFWLEDEGRPALDAVRGKGDFVYFIQPLPKEFRDPERARSAMAERFSRPDPAGCD